MIHKVLLRAILVLGLLLVFSAHVHSTFAQTDPIETIRQHSAAINKNASLYRRVKKELSGFSAEDRKSVV